jgi:hypothetical protein
MLYLCILYRFVTPLLHRCCAILESATITLVFQKCKYYCYPWHKQKYDESTEQPATTTGQQQNRIAICRMLWFTRPQHYRIQPAKSGFGAQLARPEFGNCRALDFEQVQKRNNGPNVLEVRPATPTSNQLYPAVLNSCKQRKQSANKRATKSKNTLVSKTFQRCRSQASNTKQQLKQTAPADQWQDFRCGVEPQLG